MTTSPGRASAIAGSSVAFALIFLTLSPTSPPWAKWTACGLGIFLVMLILSANRTSGEELMDLKKRLRRARFERDELERYLEALMTYVPSNIYFKDMDSRFLQVNQSLAEALGVGDPADLIGKSDSDFFDADHAERARNDEEKIIKTGKGIEKYIEKETFPNGSEGWVLSSKLPFRDRRGRIVGTFGISNDVTQLMTAQKDLERERNTLRSLLDSIPDNVYIRDLEGHYLVANQALATFVGCQNSSEVAGKTPGDFFSKTKAASFLAEDRQVVESGEPIISRESRLRNAAGENRRLQVTKVPLRDQEGKVFAIVGMNRDVTEQRKAREALKQTERRMREIIDNSPSPIYVKSLTGRYLMVNRRFEELFNLSQKDILGNTDADVLEDPEIAASVQANDQKVLEKKAGIQMDEVIHFPTGSRTYVSSKFPMKNLRGEIYAVGGISTDITERIKAEEALQKLNEELLVANDSLTNAHQQLIQAEKMESVGRLAAGIAHEVKNPLAMIGQGLELLTRHLSEDEKSIQTIERMKRAIDRAKRIVKGLVDFSSERKMEFHPYQPNDLLKATVELVEYQLKKANIEIQYELAEGLPPVIVDRTKVEQVFVNLLINASHAMENGGTLVVKTETATLHLTDHQEGSRLADRPREGDQLVRFHILDTGGGIPEDALNKLFDPFFTTKPTGKGTGLGLAVSRKIVELHGGDLTVVNRQDLPGAHATLSLRVGEELPPPHHGKDSSTPPASGDTES